MAFVAIAAVAMAGVRIVGSLWSEAQEEMKYSTWQHGPNTSVLAVGDRVVAIDDVRVGSRVVPAGTPFLVVSDMTDEDSAHEDRGVEVRFPNDPAPGPTFKIERIRLRVR